MSHRKNVLFSFVLSLVFVTTGFGAEKYIIDTPHATVAFSVRHLVISTVRGKFKDVAGVIIYDKDDLSKSSVRVTIQTTSLNTDSEDRDSHLRSADFFDVEKHPEITFQSKRIEKKEDGYIAIGDLTIRGVTKEITLPFNVVGPITDPRGNTRFGAEGNLTLNRQDYGVSWNKTMDSGGLVVGNEVKIEISIEVVKSK